MRERLTELSATYLAKAQAELTDADSAAGLRTPSWAGDPLARIVVVKGVLGDAERAGEPLLSGGDGEALRKALGALGERAEFLAIRSSRSPEGADADRLRLQLVAADPSIVIALDGQAARGVAAAYGIAGVPFGEVVRVPGTLLLAVDGFEESLADETRKRRVWRQLQTLRRARISVAAAEGKRG